MKLTPRCLTVVRHAQESLARLKHAGVSSPHLVPGLLILGNGVATHLLRRAGLSIDSVESYLAKLPELSEQTDTSNELTLGESALLAFEKAEASARLMNHTYLGTEHLLIAVLEENSGKAAEMFASFRVDRETLKQTLLQEMRGV